MKTVVTTNIKAGNMSIKLPQLKSQLLTVRYYYIVHYINFMSNKPFGSCQ